RVPGRRRVSDRRDGQLAGDSSRVRLPARVADVAAAVAIAVGLRSVAALGAVVRAVGHAVAVEIASGVLDAAFDAGLERARIAGVTDAVLVGVGLLAPVHRTDRVEDRRAV